MDTRLPINQKRFTLVILCLLAALMLPAGPFTGTPDVAAQSRGDTLQLASATPTATAGATSDAATVWVGRLMSNTLGVTEGQGSIFRVYVQGVLDAPIELRSGDSAIFGVSGSKPEYGQYAAEFAPVTQGVWTVSVPSLNASLQVEADNYNLAIIEFVQIPAAEATQVTAPTITPTPLGAVTWGGQLVSEERGKGVPFARLLVQVAGQDSQPVQLSTVDQVINTAFTGQKPAELGPHTVEFTGLTPGRYFVEPLGLRTSLAVELKPNVETRVEFKPQTPTATPIGAAAPTISSPTATAALLPATPVAPPPATATATPSATPSATPLPTDTPVPAEASPTPVTRWIGAIESRQPQPDSSAISVRVPGIEGLSIRLKSHDDTTLPGDPRCITGNNGHGQDVCHFENLSSGRYMVSPEGLAVSLPITLFDRQLVNTVFDVEVLPPGITGWQAQLTGNSNGYGAQARNDSAIRVRVDGRPGQVVALRSPRTGMVQYCEVVFNPVFGTLMCEFGDLGAGVYQVEALNTGAGTRLFVDGVGRAEILFAPTASYAAEAGIDREPLVGWGALPKQQPTTTPTASPTPRPRQVTASPTTPTATYSRPTFTPTPTQTATRIPASPTPSFAWQGRVIERTTTGAGALGVRAAGLKDHPVIVRSGSWQSPPQLTGSKSELGEYGVEFGGLAQGEYIIELVDLAEVKISIGSGEYVLVEFRYDFVAD